MIATAISFIDYSYRLIHMPGYRVYITTANTMLSILLCIDRFFVPTLAIRNQKPHNNNNNQCQQYFILFNDFHNVCFHAFCCGVVAFPYV